jgi:hypothetical protein
MPSHIITSKRNHQWCAVSLKYHVLSATFTWCIQFKWCNELNVMFNLISTLLWVYMEAVKWRLNRSSSELVATGAGRTCTNISDIPPLYIFFGSTGVSPYYTEWLVIFGFTLLLNTLCIFLSEKTPCMWSNWTVLNRKNVFEEQSVLWGSGGEI